MRIKGMTKMNMKRRSFLKGTVAMAALLSVPAVAVPKPIELPGNLTFHSSWHMFYIRGDEMTDGSVRMIVDNDGVGYGQMRENGFWVPTEITAG